MYAVRRLPHIKCCTCTNLFVRKLIFFLARAVALFFQQSENKLAVHYVCAVFVLVLLVLLPLRLLLSLYSSYSRIVAFGTTRACSIYNHFLPFLQTIYVNKEDVIGLLFIIFSLLLFCVWCVLSVCAVRA